MNVIDLINEGVKSAAKDPEKLKEMMCPSGMGLEMELTLAIGNLKSLGEVIERADTTDTAPKHFMLNLGCLIQHQADVCEVLRANQIQLLKKGKI